MIIFEAENIISISFDDFFCKRLAKFGIDLENPEFPLLGQELPDYLYEQTG
ncbi:hypothetical protein [Nostoc sp.]|uniref:hypothetical protein n=1 Tax=Nostoc sp. TaxID=1180 RepID=UPI002FF8C007